MKKWYRRTFFGGGKSTFFGGSSSAAYSDPIPVVAQLKNLFNRMFFNRQG